MNSSIAVLVVAIAVTGYLVATQCYRFKYHVARQSGHRLYLTSLLIGFACMLFGALVATPVGWLFSGLDFSAILAVTTALAGLGYTLAYNCFKENAREQALWDAWQADDLERICGLASIDFKPIAITLDTNKIYVGLIGDTLEPSSHGGYLSILPLYSGYRDKDTLEFRLTNRYQTLIDGVLENEQQDKSQWLDYLIVVPRERIVTLHVFNDHLYQDVSGQNAG